jgi:hypothetical protein
MIELNTPTTPIVFIHGDVLSRAEGRIWLYETSYYTVDSRAT